MNKDKYCEKCNHTGSIVWIEDGYAYAKPCECQIKLDFERRIKRSGLANLFEEYTFDKFTVKASWQKTIKDKALSFIENPFGHWFYIGGNSGCVDMDTEYFNGVKWNKISNYAIGEKVLQWIPNGKLKGKGELVLPKRYIKEKAKILKQIKTDRGAVDQVLSLNHNFAYFTSKGNVNKKRFEDVIKMHNSSVEGFSGKIATTFDYSGKGIDLTNEEIRLMVAVIADGHFVNKNRCSINIKKQRKKDRIEIILKNADYEYKRYDRKDGYSQFIFYTPRIEKKFTEYWYECSKEQLEIVCDEVLYWDGHITENRLSFSSNEKESIDFIQFAFASIGTRSTIHLDEREGRNTNYQLIISNNKFVSMLGSTSKKEKTKIIDYETKDGYEYCFEVDSGYLILRRNGRIFITGNSGKTMICTAMVSKLVEQGHDAYYFQWREDSVKLKMNINDFEYYNNELNKYKTVKVLYIDDLFKGNSSPSEADLRLLFDLINYRYNNKELITIISSEKLIDDIIEIDQAIGSRIYQRSKEYNIKLAENKALNQRMI